MSKKQLSHILGAGTVTGVLLALMMLLSGGDVGNAAGETAVSTQTAPSGITEVVPMENYNQLQAQNEQLMQDLQTMQAREQQIQDQINAANSYESEEYEEYEEDDEYEDHDDKHEYDDEE